MRTDGVLRSDTGLLRTTATGLVWLLPFVGLRRSEIQGLTWDRLDLDRRILRVEVQLRDDGTLDPGLKTPKSRRTVSLPERAAKALKECKLACPPNPLNLVFPAPRGRPQSRCQTYRIWRKACSDAGLAGLDLHDLRHSFATWQLSAGVNPKWVSDQLGHEKPSITLDTYTHLLPSEDDQATLKIAAWYDSQPRSEVSGHMGATPAVITV
jgi:integrase